MSEISQVKGHCKPARPSDVIRAINLFREKAEKRDLTGTKMLLVLVLAKYRGIRAGDAVRLKWCQVNMNSDFVLFKPINYKNQRYRNRWEFRIEATGNTDDIIFAINRLKELSSGVTENDYLFGAWKTTTISYHLRRNTKSIGTCLTIHRIRVLTVLSLTALNWSDSEIKDFLNWSSFESLDIYRQGIEISALTNKNNLRELYSNDELVEKLDSQIEK